MRGLIIIFILSFFSFNGFAQSKSAAKKLTDSINSLDFLTITVRHWAERYERNEVNVMYHHDNKLKIHSILKSNSRTERQIDTIFALSGAQQMLVDKFGVDFKNNQIGSTDTIFAGTKTLYSVTLNNLTTVLENKSGYSLILDLLKMTDK